MPSFAYAKQPTLKALQKKVFQLLSETQFRLTLCNVK